MVSRHYDRSKLHTGGVVFQSQLELAAGHVRHHQPLAAGHLAEPNRRCSSLAVVRLAVFTPVRDQQAAAGRGDVRHQLLSLRQRLGLRLHPRWSIASRTRRCPWNSLHRRQRFRQLEHRSTAGCDFRSPGRAVAADPDQAACAQGGSRDTMRVALVTAFRAAVRHPAQQTELRRIQAPPVTDQLLAICPSVDLATLYLGRARDGRICTNRLPCENCGRSLPAHGRAVRTGPGHAPGARPNLRAV